MTWMTWVEDFQFLRRLPARRSNSLGDTFRPSGSFTIQGRLFSTRTPFRCRLDTGTRAAGADAAPGSGPLHACESLWEPTEDHARDLPLPLSRFVQPQGVAQHQYACQMPD